MNFPDDDIAKLKELISQAYQAVNKRADPSRTERRRPKPELKRASELRGLGVLGLVSWWEGLLPPGIW